MTLRRPTLNPQAVSRRRQKEAVLLDISLNSQGFPGLSRATSLCHHTVQLPMACRVINNENNTTRQPRSQTGVEGGQRRMRVRQGCREDNAYLSSLKPAPTGRPLPWAPHKDTVQSSSHPTPSSLVFTGDVFKATVLILESLGGPWDVLKHNYKPSYFDIQRNIQEGLVGIGHPFAAQARDWKANRNAQR